MKNGTRKRGKEWKYCKEEEDGDIRRYKMDGEMENIYREEGKRKRMIKRQNEIDWKRQSKKEGE